MPIPRTAEQHGFHVRCLPRLADADVRLLDREAVIGKHKVRQSVAGASRVAAAQQHDRA
ncbi:hypothetical protein D3C71_2239480 [compost metagenome]